PVQKRAGETQVRQPAGQIVEPAVDVPPGVLLLLQGVLALLQLGDGTPLQGHDGLDPCIGVEARCDAADIHAHARSPPRAPPSAHLCRPKSAAASSPWVEILLMRLARPHSLRLPKDPSTPTRRSAGPAAAGCGPRGPGSSQAGFPGSLRPSRRR